MSVFLFGFLKLPDTGKCDICLNIFSGLGIPFYKCPCTIFNLNGLIAFGKRGRRNVSTLFCGCICRLYSQNCGIGNVAAVGILKFITYTYKFGLDFFPCGSKDHVVCWHGKLAAGLDNCIRGHRPTRKRIAVQRRGSGPILLCAAENAGLAARHAGHISGCLSRLAIFICDRVLFFLDIWCVVVILIFCPSGGIDDLMRIAAYCICHRGGPIGEHIILPIRVAILIQRNSGCIKFRSSCTLKQTFVWLRGKDLVVHTVGINDSVGVFSVVGFTIIVFILCPHGVNCVGLACEIQRGNHAHRFRSRIACGMSAVQAPADKNNTGFVALGFGRQSDFSAQTYRVTTGSVELRGRRRSHKSSKLARVGVIGQLVAGDGRRICCRNSAVVYQHLSRVVSWNIFGRRSRGSRSYSELDHQFFSISTILFWLLRHIVSRVVISGHGYRLVYHAHCDLTCNVNTIVPCVIPLIRLLVYLNISLVRCGVILGNNILDHSVFVQIGVGRIADRIRNGGKYIIQILRVCSGIRTLLPDNCRSAHRPTGPR